MSSNNKDSTTEPSKVSGQFHSAKGTVVETIGDLAGSTSWSESGSKEHSTGEAELCRGNAGPPCGKKNTVVGAITGDREQETSGNVQHEKGQAQQNLNNPSS
ncbi:mismatched base pair and cruciform DNA recognition protein [Multifurca ochricompacta]|uniref:Mismatched base pair and cruciform DNA recognition protein n=1 Tax=Multifurca ochricompacta TaxID=376703 RepID=A0AAD4LX24_9AGAM|nr:mismatched base pair and cruciform DNA recognition protein [Multifurca ochricompacta]